MMKKYDELEKILQKMEKYNINLNGVNTMLFIGIYEELVKLNKFNNPIKSDSASTAVYYENYKEKAKKEE